MVKVLRRLVHEPLHDVPLELRIMVDGNVLVVPAATLARIRSQVLAHHKLNSGREAAEKELLSALWRIRHPDAQDAPTMTTNVKTSTTGFPISPRSDVLMRGGQRSALRQRSPGWPMSSC